MSLFFVHMRPPLKRSPFKICPCHCHKHHSIKDISLSLFSIFLEIVSNKTGCLQIFKLLYLYAADILFKWSVLRNGTRLSSNLHETCGKMRSLHAHLLTFWQPAGGAGLKLQGLPTLLPSQEDQSEGRRFVIRVF